MSEKTRKQDRRTRYTRQTIKNTFLELLTQKSFTKITVTEICKNAEINRGTFYLHYYDIISGLILSASPATSPEASAIFIIPVHIAVIPAIEIQRLTASPEHDTKAFVTSSTFPTSTPYIIPIRSIPPHRYAIAVPPNYSLSLYFIYLHLLHIHIFI